MKFLRILRKTSWTKSREASETTERATLRKKTRMATEMTKRVKKAMNQNVKMRSTPAKMLSSSRTRMRV